VLEEGVFCIEELLGEIYRQGNGDPVPRGGIIEAGDAVVEKPILD